MCRTADDRQDALDEAELCLTCTLNECDQDDPACPWRASVFAKREEYRLRYLRDNESDEYRVECNRKRRAYYKERAEQFREYHREYYHARQEGRPRRKVRLSKDGV